MIRTALIIAAITSSSALLGGCIGRQEMVARHDVTCRSYGFVPGSEGFAYCLLQLEVSDYGYGHHGRRPGFWAPQQAPFPANTPQSPGPQQN